ncbi:TPA: hypothetical protein ACW9LW_004138 [Klebsiella pneumoniae]
MQSAFPTISGCRAPSVVWKKAIIEVAEFYKGRKNYSRVKPNFYLVIRLGLRWRLLSRNNGKHWYLMTHESYNKESKL